MRKEAGATQRIRSPPPLGACTQTMADGWLAGMAGAGRLRRRKKKKRVEEGKEEEEV